MNPLNAYMALEIMHDRFERAERERRARERRSSAAALRRRHDPAHRPDDWPASSGSRSWTASRAGGPALVAEVDDRMLAAHWLGRRDVADPFRPTAELVSLLTRGAHLGERPRRHRRSAGVARDPAVRVRYS